MNVVFKKYLRDNNGATAVEYAILVGLIATAIVTALNIIGSKLTSIFTQVQNGF